MTEHNAETTTDESNDEQTLADLAPAHHGDGTTPEDASRLAADDPSPETFEAVVEAVRDEYERKGHDPVDDTVPTPIGLAVELTADAAGFDSGSMIDFDGSDEVRIEYDSFDQDDAHATPMPLIRLATYADDATDRTVRFRDGAGMVKVFVEVPERREDDEDFADSFDEAVDKVDDDR